MWDWEVTRVWCGCAGRRRARDARRPRCAVSSDDASMTGTCQLLVFPQYRRGLRSECRFRRYCLPSTPPRQRSTTTLLGSPPFELMLHSRFPSFLPGADPSLSFELCSIRLAGFPTSSSTKAGHTTTSVEPLSITAISVHRAELIYLHVLLLGAVDICYLCWIP